MIICFLFLTLLFLWSLYLFDLLSGLALTYSTQGIEISIVPNLFTFSNINRDFSFKVTEISEVLETERNLENAGNKDALVTPLTDTREGTSIQFSCFQSFN